MEPVAQAEQSEAPASDARVFSWRERLQLFLISWAGYLLIRLICPTLRYSAVTEPGTIADLNGPYQASIFPFWHRCVIPASYKFRNLGIAVMTSKSFDGEYIARIIEKLGFRAVRGSSSRGGAAALLGMRRELEADHTVAFTIDGPRGPRYVAKPGPVLLAKITGRPITCFYMHVERAWILNSWDQMMIPKPFSDVMVYATAPIYVPQDASDEQMKSFHQQMQDALERARLGAATALRQ
ncbi:MAG TPA: lysophospholipid acyltransferase family protein [Candidatus Limnocylindrales bacterium]|nr:lysophospholipid acyltransferase family protein [Candidatus Limnocylindrales bacterium]